MKRRKLVAASLLLPAWPALSQDAYPSKTIQIFVPFPPGGVADITARPLAHVMGRLVKQSVVVVNKPGAGGSVGVPGRSAPSRPAWSPARCRPRRAAGRPASGGSRG